MDSVEGVSLSMEKLSFQVQDLSEDFVLTEILTKMPVKPLMRFKSVSKGWLARISSDPFKADHLHHHSNAEKPCDMITRAVHWDDDGEEDILRLYLIGHGESTPEEIDMSYVTKAQERSEEISSFYLLGSSNGLVLIQQLYREGQSLVVLWNPATREFRNLPEPTVPTMIPEMGLHCGFLSHSIGFGKDCNAYKIVRIGEYHSKDGETGFRCLLHVQLYTKTSGCWREIEVISGYMLIGNVEGGAVMDGAVYWAIKRGELGLGKGSQFRVLTFDLESEELKEIDGPASQSDDDYVHLELIKWKGSVGALMTTLHAREHRFWLKSNGLGWTRMFNIKPPVSFWPFRGILRDEFLLFDNGNREDLLYDPVTEKTRRFGDVVGRIP